VGGWVGGWLCVGNTEQKTNNTKQALTYTLRLLDETTDLMVFENVCFGLNRTVAHPKVGTTTK